LVRISIVVALSLLGDQLLYAVLPVMHEAMGVPVTAVGLILSANRLVRLVTNSLSGYVIDRFGRRWPFIGALLLGGVTTIAYGGLSGVWIFLMARLLWGAAWSFLRIEGLSTALDVASVDTRGRMMGIFQSISRLGGAIAMLVGGVPDRHDRISLDVYHLWRCDLVLLKNLADSTVLIFLRLDAG
jgi:MFS family permease